MEKLVSEIERNAVAEEFVNENIKSASSKLSAELMRQKTNPPRPVERKLSGRGQVPQPKIQKVPQVLRDEQKSLEKYYDPMWISIGPIHHGNPKFRLAEQHFKFLFAAKFVKNSGHQSHDYLYRKVMENIKELKQCFDDEVLDEYYGNGKDDEALGWMLFLDGCFTLQFIYSTVNGESMRHFEIKNDQVAFVFHDFFLLENQIPYLVLRLLMDNSEKEFSKSLQGSIMQFLNFNVLTPEKYRKAVMVPPKDMPVHLLDFLRLALLQQSYHYGNRRSNSCIYTCLLACLPRQLRNKLLSPPSLYKPKRSTNNTKTEVSSYISFLDSLIDYPNDVKELRSSHVLHNLLGCDKEVALLFNEMGRFLVPNPEAYEEVISQIEKHYHNKCLTWIAQVLNEHFSTPWTIVTFVAAFLALGMSVIQTYYTIYPRGG
ncbi:uncharacterized protein LOC133831600 [Humulus lupulus]|uniref:uncharacterized protein LOC133831600 n=1 Tax=Humulus lupulus TaxID=3486 RepID=UPI002B4027A4|nr:uncharacterized protein LOC133831600 [Humulus lupulus]